MTVHYKFKSSKDYDTITFLGSHISVGDLKRSIIAKQKLGKATDIDLKITNAQTGEGMCRCLCLFLLLSLSLAVFVSPWRLRAC